MNRSNSLLGLILGLAASEERSTSRSTDTLQAVSQLHLANLDFRPMPDAGREETLEALAELAAIPVDEIHAITFGVLRKAPQEGDPVPCPGCGEFHGGVTMLSAGIGDPADLKAMMGLNLSYLSSAPVDAYVAPTQEAPTSTPQ